MSRLAVERPFLSVVMPAHQAESLLPDTLGALESSQLPREQWQLIVADDCSRDDTARVAERYADKVIRLTGSPHGPAAARNAAVEFSLGEWLVFIDSDVRVHPDTLTRIVDTIQRNPDIVALFGAYDDRPQAAGFISQYRNLLHRYGHIRGAGDAETFWAGCGAIRKSAFVAVGGFDAVRFPRPQIEDIELGYRLRDAGGRILLEPSIQGTHLKRWTLGNMLRTDFRERGVPWMRLMLERRRLARGSLNTTTSEKIKVALAAAALPLVVLGLAARIGAVTILGLLCMGLLVFLNLPVHRFFSRVRGPSFAIATVPLHLAHYGLNAVSAAVATVMHYGPAALSERRSR